MSEEDKAAQENTAKEPEIRPAEETQAEERPDGKEKPAKPRHKPAPKPVSLMADLQKKYAKITKAYASAGLKPLTFRQFVMTVDIPDNGLDLAEQDRAISIRIPAKAAEAAAKALEIRPDGKELAAWLVRAAKDEENVTLACMEKACAGTIVSYADIQRVATQFFGTDERFANPSILKEIVRNVAEKFRDGRAAVTIAEAAEHCIQNAIAEILAED